MHHHAQIDMLDEVVFYIMHSFIEYYHPENITSYWLGNIKNLITVPVTDTCRAGFGVVQWP